MLILCIVNHDSDATSHESGDTNDSNGSRDDVSYEGYAVASMDNDIDLGIDALKTLNECHDKPMEEDSRRIMIRGLKLIKLLIDTKADNEILTQFWHRWCKACWRLWPDSKAAKNTLLHIKNKIVTQYCDLAGVLVDEFINHNTHCWSSLINEVNALWKKPNWWQKFWKKWQQKNKHDKINDCDVTKLADDKSKFFRQSVGRRIVIKIIFDWITNLEYADQLERVKKNEMKISDVKASIFFAIFCHDFTEAFVTQNIGSVVRIEDKNKKVKTKANKRKGNNNNRRKQYLYNQRKFQLPDEVTNWINNAYSNKSSVLYWLLYESNDESTDKFQYFDKYGFNDQNDPRISLNEITTNERMQWCFLNNMTMMCCKFMIFYELIEVSLNGAFEWNINCLHRPMKDIYSVAKKIIHAHYYVETQKPIGKQKTFRYNSNDNTNYHTNDKSKTANSHDRLQWKIDQCLTIYKHNLANKEIACDRVWESIVCLDDQHEFWTEPQSASWGLYSPSSIRSTSAKLGQVITQDCDGVSANKTQWSDTALAYNTQWQKDSDHLHYLDNDDDLQIKYCVEKMLENMKIDWQNSAKYCTGMTTEQRTQTFWKIECIKPKTRWNKVRVAAQRFDLFYALKYYGSNLRWCNGKQYYVINSISYATAAKFMYKQKCSHVVDNGANFCGNKWYIENEIQSDWETNPPSVYGVAKSKTQNALQQSPLTRATLSSTITSPFEQNNDLIDDIDTSVTTTKNVQNIKQESTMLKTRSQRRKARKNTHIREFEAKQSGNMYREGTSNEPFVKNHNSTLVPTARSKNAQTQQLMQNITAAKNKSLQNRKERKQSRKRGVNTQPTLTNEAKRRNVTNVDVIELD